MVQLGTTQREEKKKFCVFLRRVSLSLWSCENPETNLWCSNRIDRFTWIFCDRWFGWKMNGGDDVVAAAPAGPPVPLEWKFSQVFGERTAGEEVQEGNLFVQRCIWLEKDMFFCWVCWIGSNFCGGVRVWFDLLWIVFVWYYVVLLSNVCFFILGHCYYRCLVFVWGKVVGLFVWPSDVFLFLHCGFSRLDFETVKVRFFDLVRVFGLVCCFLAFACVLVIYVVYNRIL